MMRATRRNPPDPDLGTAHPEILHPGDPNDRARLHELRCLSPRPAVVHDTIRAQLRELVLLSIPSAVPCEQLVEARVAEILKGMTLDEFGTYFPWSTRLVHLLP